MFQYQRPDLPKRASRKTWPMARRSAPVSIPSARILAAVAGPIPWNLSMGSAAIVVLYACNRGRLQALRETVDAGLNAAALPAVRRPDLSTTTGLE
mgnify:CR=1 FL=1